MAIVLVQRGPEDTPITELLDHYADYLAGRLEKLGCSREFIVESAARVKLHTQAKPVLSHPNRFIAEIPAADVPPAR